MRFAASALCFALASCVGVRAAWESDPRYEESCDFKGRELTELPSRTLWEHCSYIIDLRGNEIHILRTGSFSGVSLKTNVYAQYNDITIIETGAFSSATCTNTIALWNNAVHTIQPAAFQDAVISRLQLHLNRIDLIGVRAFESAVIDRFYLHDNAALIRIEEGAFANASISELYLNVKVASVAPGAFEGAVVDSFDMHDSVLPTVTAGFFSGLTATTLDLSDSRIEHIERDALKDGLIDTLILSGNPLESCSLNGVQNLRRLDMNNTGISFIPQDISHMNDLTTLIIAGGSYSTNFYLDAHTVAELFDSIDAVAHDCLIQWYWEPCDGAAASDERVVTGSVIREATATGRHCDEISHRHVRLCSELESLRPSPSASPSPSVSHTPSVTPSISRSPSITTTISVTPSVTPSISVTPSVTPSISHSPSNTPSTSVSPSVSPTHSRTPSTTSSMIPAIASTPHHQTTLVALAGVGLTLSVVTTGLLIFQCRVHRKTLQFDRERRFTQARQGMNWHTNPQHTVQVREALGAGEEKRTSDPGPVSPNNDSSTRSSAADRSEVSDPMSTSRSMLAPSPAWGLPGPSAPQAF